MSGAKREEKERKSPAGSSERGEIWRKRVKKPHGRERAGRKDSKKSKNAPRRCVGGAKNIGKGKKSPEAKEKPCGELVQRPNQSPQGKLFNN